MIGFPQRLLITRLGMALGIAVLFSGLGPATPAAAHPLGNFTINQ